MARSIRRPRRALSTALALVLAVETVSAVAAAAATRTATHPLPDAAPAGVVLAADATAQPGMGPVEAAGRTTGPAAAGPARVADEPDFAKPVRVARILPAAAPAVSRAADPVAADRGARLARAAAAAGAAAPRGGGGRAAAGAPAEYRGRNHVWIPELGINRSVAWFPCSRQRDPDNLMYRWGCAGANNVYLMGHAHSVMKPLHDVYTSGRLHRGMKAWYADGNGRVHVFAVRWWKVTRPTTDAAWAWAPQSTSSMTLQTCVGRNSQYRLMVRLVEVDG